MPAIGPISRNDLIRHLRQIGFEGPFSGGKHQLMLRGRTRLRIPNPHKGDIDRGLLRRLLRQAGVSREEWEPL